LDEALVPCVPAAESDDVVASRPRPGWLGFVDLETGDRFGGRASDLGDQAGVVVDAQVLSVASTVRVRPAWTMLTWILARPSCGGEECPYLSVVFIAKPLREASPRLGSRVGAGGGRGSGCLPDAAGLLLPTLVQRPSIMERLRCSTALVSAQGARPGHESPRRLHSCNCQEWIRVLQGVSWASSARRLMELRPASVRSSLRLRTPIIRRRRDTRGTSSGGRGRDRVLPVPPRTGLLRSGAAWAAAAGHGRSRRALRRSAQARS